MTQWIRASTFHQQEGAEDWRVVSDGACTFVPTGSIVEAASFVQAIASLPGLDDEPPDIDVRSGGVTVRLVTRSTDNFGMSQRDLERARAISAAARELGFAPDPSAVQNLMVVVGSQATAEILPFWQAVLGYVPRPDSPAEDLVDPADRGLGVWFESMDELRADGGGAIHLAVWVPPEQAEARVAAALAAGGRVVRDTGAPMWWTLADAAGNEVDVSTILGRD